MKRRSLALAALLALLPLATQAQTSEDDVSVPSQEERTELALSAVPPLVMDAARSAAPDVFFTGALRYWDNDFLVYRMSGRLFREVWDVYVREDGVVLRTSSDYQDD